MGLKFRLCFEIGGISEDFDVDGESDVADPRLVVGDFWRGDVNVEVSVSLMTRGLVPHQILAPFPAEEMEACVVSERGNSMAANNEKVIERVRRL